eukprot:TRINITY_DN4378_c0_g1_i1.p1 TRINITY_DN4378_c0_g1~~TRINITY_DN4378_c0_g1_i1.p1  ORF type:complete len:265 (-),score=17.04 TRINITY_DN4378_c0_g1_i1:3-797(-)
MADDAQSPESNHDDLDGGSGGGEGGNSSVREQDRFLPVANISRIMKKALPQNAKIAKDAKETVQECVSEFISFITSEASDKCQREKRKTINGDDLLWAMSTLGFEDYVTFTSTERLKARRHPWPSKGVRPQGGRTLWWACRQWALLDRCRGRETMEVLLLPCSICQGRCRHRWGASTTSNGDTHAGSRGLSSEQDATFRVPSTSLPFFPALQHLSTRAACLLNPTIQASLQLLRSIYLGLLSSSCIFFPIPGAPPSSLCCCYGC